MRPRSPPKPRSGRANLSELPPSLAGRSRRSPTGARLPTPSALRPRGRSELNDGRSELKRSRRSPPNDGAGRSERSSRPTARGARGARGALRSPPRPAGRPAPRRSSLRPPALRPPAPRGARRSRASPISIEASLLSVSFATAALRRVIGALSQRSIERTSCRSSRVTNERASPVLEARPALPVR